VSSVQYNPEILQRLSAFILNRTTDNLRSDLHEYLVMMSLSADKDNRGLTKGQIIKSIEEDLGVNNFPTRIVDVTLLQLSKKRLIESVHGKREKLYLLSQDKRNKIELMKKQYEETITNVQKNLAKRISEELGTSIDIGLESMAFNKFREFLGVTLSNLGSKCCFAIVASKGKDITILQPINAIEVLNNILKPIKNQKLRKGIKQGILKYIDDPDDDFCDFLFSLAQSYFLIQIMRLDPLCESYTKESLQRKKIYLDTNVIVHAITGIGRRTKAVDKALKLTSKLNIRIAFSRRTKGEFLSLIRDSRRRYGKNPRIAKLRYKKMFSRISDGLFKHYMKKRKQNPNLTFEAYCERLLEIETILKNRYSVDYDDGEYGEIIKDPYFLTMRERVLDEGINFGLHKSEPVAAHDAFHILLIDQLRKQNEGDFLGPKYWFLTHDRSLEFVEKTSSDEIPSSIYMDNWIQFISPLIAPEQIKDAKKHMRGCLHQGFPF
jgi:predicted nucleic acid-binding protein